MSKPHTKVPHWLSVSTLNANPTPDPTKQTKHETINSFYKTNVNINQRKSTVGNVMGTADCVTVPNMSSDSFLNFLNTFCISAKQKILLKHYECNQLTTIRHRRTKHFLLSSS